MERKLQMIFILNFLMLVSVDTGTLTLNHPVESILGSRRSDGILGTEMLVIESRFAKGKAEKSIWPSMVAVIGSIDTINEFFCLGTIDNSSTRLSNPGAEIFKLKGFKISFVGGIVIFYLNSPLTCEFFPTWLPKLMLALFIGSPVIWSISFNVTGAKPKAPNDLNIIAGILTEEPLST